MGTNVAKYIQGDRPMAVSTPLGKDALLLVGFLGQEAISQPFNFELQLLAENDTEVPFDQLLGQPIAVELELPGSRFPREKKRYFSGICNRVTQGGHDMSFTEYRMTIVPQFWLLTKRAQSRIFQQMSVPDILKKVLAGLDVVYEIQGTFQPRDCCVQYRETDFNFASRLMEEEGIYYFFKHSSGGHTMVLANTPQSHPELPNGSQVLLEQTYGGNRPDDRILGWEKTQELRSGKTTLWDHCFELPHKHLEADKTVPDTVMVGKVPHKLKVGGNDKLEIYDYPGEYAQRFDGVDKGGGDRPGDLPKIFQDNQRTVDIRMQQETLPALQIQGTSLCKQFATGYKFTKMDLQEGTPVADGQFVLTGVTHVARLGSGSYQSREKIPFQYHNNFTCIPIELPYRPLRTTPKPFVQGTQTAIVVGPPGEEIFTDKYGRVKVQFHWDRQGKNTPDSSSWIRVGTPWAGKQWGMIHIPRVGQEVIVDFQEGDPDMPIIIGSVYNAELMPPYTLPDNKTQSGLKTHSTLNGGAQNFNELRFEDKKGSEDVYFHAEKDFHRKVENDDDLKVGNDQTIEIENNRTAKIKKGDDKLQIEKGNREVKIDMGNDTLTISMGNQKTKLDLGKSETEALQSIELKVGQSSIKLDQTGVTIKGMMVSVEGQLQTQVKGLMTQINGDAMLQLQGGIMMIG